MAAVNIAQEHREKAQVSGVILAIEAEEDRGHCVYAVCIQCEVVMLYSLHQ